MSFIQNVSAGAVRSGASVLYATLGEIVAERAGVINLGVEGSMLAGACAGFIVTYRTGNAYVGVLAAALAGAALALVHAFLAITRGANQLASGLACVFFGLGITAFIGRPYVGKQINGLGNLPIPVLSDLPFVGSVLFDHDLLTYLVFPLGPALWWLLFRSRWGLLLRAAGESREGVFAAGLSPQRLQYIAVAIGGLLAGLGGAQLSLAYTQTWVDGMTNGRGFIAVALVIFAMWNPLRGVVGALLFGGAIAFQLQLQARGVGISQFFLDMTPYVLTLLVLLVWNRQSQRAAPQGLNDVFRGTA